MNSIVTFKLSQKDHAKLMARNKQVNGAEIIKFDNIKALIESASREKILFLNIDESVSKEDLLEILRRFKPRLINIVFSDKNFELLMLASKYQVNAVFDGDIKLLELERAFVKMNLMNKDGLLNLPVAGILDIFSVPVKIKTDQDLFRRVSTYLKKLSAVRSFGLFIKSNDKEEDLGVLIPSNVKAAIKKWDLPRKYIGLENELADWVVTPVFSYREEKSFLCIQIEPGFKEFVLNEHFYKYLENTLIYRMNTIKKERLQLLASTDEITGLFNQRKLAEDLEIAISTHAKEHENFSLMFIDVDHFKKVNDNYGHVVGSQLLIDIGNVLFKILRQSDHIYRYGGDEFVVIMPYVDIKVVHDIAKRVLAEIKSTEFKIEGNETYNLSVSIGIAEYPTDAKSAKEIISFADEMMYMSKRSGRGKVFHVGEVEDVSSRS